MRFGTHIEWNKIGLKYVFIHSVQFMLNAWPK